MISAQRLRETLHYDPETGVFRWLVSPNNRVKAGSVAGNIDPKGYRRIKIAGRSYYANRLAWLYQTGEWPNDEVDHENGVSGDDRWCNLREATRTENQWNYPRPRTNTSGVKGVSWHKRDGKWQALIRVNGRRINLGYFADLDDAAAAYAAASEKYHGEFRRVA